MSHIAQVKTQVKDLDVFREILGLLGFKLTGKAGKVRAMDGGTREVVDKVEGHEIGVHSSVNESGETIYQLTGEFYRGNFNGQNYYGKEGQLADKINQQYAARKIKKELELQGYQMQENPNFEVDAQGNIVMSLVSYQ